MRRRDFIAALGRLAALPFAAFAQSDRMRLIGLLVSQREGEQEAKDRIAALRDGLQKLGWTEGRNTGSRRGMQVAALTRMRAYAKDLANLNPDILFAAATSLAALSRATTTIPIVFAQVTDPVGAGFVSSLARPGGHITGFTQHEFSIAIKWMELLKQLAPQTERRTDLRCSEPGDRGIPICGEGKCSALRRTAIRVPCEQRCRNRARY